VHAAPQGAARRGGRRCGGRHRPPRHPPPPAGRRPPRRTSQLLQRLGTIDHYVERFRGEAVGVYQEAPRA
jgi:hypothetical protein